MTRAAAVDRGPVGQETPILQHEVGKAAAVCSAGRQRTGNAEESRTMIVPAVTVGWPREILSDSDQMFATGTSSVPPGPADSIER